MSDSSVNRDPIEMLADSFVARFRAGERPSIEEYTARYPDLADEIRELLPALVMIEQDISVTGATADRSERPANQGWAPRQLGDFLILCEVGRGGMGVVYEAVQQSLGRHVALKVLTFHGLGGSSHRERFRLEARAAARLHHTNIVPIYGVGEHDGTLFYAMQFIQGHGLDVIFEELRQLRGGLAPAAGAPAARAEATTGEAAQTPALTLAQGLMAGRYQNGSGPAPTLAGTPTSDLPAEAGLSGTQAYAGTGAPAEPADVPAAGPPASADSLRGVHSEFAMSTETHFYRGVARVGIQVAEALTYAHGQGVLHRDIKPSNLLMDAAGTVWVTDFGLAKAEGSEGPTQTGDIVGTLRYMAPERFDGWSDPRSDVYALGATLYELLTLRPLFEDAHRARLIERVLHEEPAPPRKLDRHFPRDLETIVLKALAKEPAARYATAAVLAEDLRRFADDKPILARRAGTLERTWRWSRRNPAMAGLAAALFLVMLAVTAASVVAAAHFDRLAKREGRTAQAEHIARFAAQKAREEAVVQRLQAEHSRKEAEAQHRQAENARAEAEAQRQRAEANFARARAAVDDYLTKVSESQLLTVPGLQPLRRDLLQSALTFYQAFLKERGTDPSIRAGLAAAYYRVGMIQSELGADSDYRVGMIPGELGAGRKAKESLEQAIALYEALVTENPNDRELQHSLAQCYFHSGALAQAIAIWKPLVAAEPADTRFRNKLAWAYNALARQQQSLHPDVALHYHQEALALREALVRLDPEDPAFQHDLGQTLNNLGFLLRRERRVPEALAMYRRAAEHGRAAAAKAPETLSNAQLEAIVTSNIAAIEKESGHYEEALRRYQRAIDIWKKLATENPAVPAFPGNLQREYLALSRLQRTMGRPDEAARSLRLARDILERLPNEGAADLYQLAGVRALCAAQDGQGEPSDEEKAERRRNAELAVEALRGAIAAGFKNVASLKANESFASLRQRPDFQELVAKLEATVKAEATAEAVRVAAARQLKTDWEAAVKAETLAKTARGTGTERLKAQQEALAIRQTLVQNAPDNRALQADLAASQHAVGLLLIGQGRTEEAAKTLSQALALRATLVAADPRNAAQRADLGSTHVALGSIHWKAGRLIEAVRSAQQGLELLEEAVRPEPRDPTLLTQLAEAHWTVGDQYWSVGLFREAADHLDRSFQLEPPKSPIRWYSLGLLRLYLGDRRGYREITRQMPQRFAGDLLDVVRTCNLGPDSVADLAEIVRRAEKAPEFSDPADGMWKAKNLAFSLYRTGRFEEARAVAQSLPATAPANWPDLALLEQALGNAESARAWLRKFESRYDTIWTRALARPELDLPTTISRINLVRVLILRREGWQKIEGRAAPEEPWWHLQYGRIHARLGEPDKAVREIEAAIAVRPDDLAVALACSRVLGDLGMGDQRMAVLARFIERNPNDARAWIARGHLFAERGDHSAADADFAHAATLAPDTLSNFIEAGWWAVGPYPENLAHECPPEHDPDPSRPVAALGGGAELRWRPAPTGDDGRVYLREIFAADHISAYAMTYVVSPQERSALLLVGGHNRVRIWLNGALVHETTTTSPPGRWGHYYVPVTLRAGRNILLAKVNHTSGLHYLVVRLADDPLDRGDTLAELGLWPEAAALYAKGRDQNSRYDLEFFRRLATLLLIVGDGAGYRRACAEMLELFGNTKDPDTAETVAELCNLSPETGADFARLMPLAELGMKRQPRDQSVGWRLCADGLAYYRSGQFDKAIERLAKHAERTGQPRLWTVLAMAHQRLGHTDEARKWLAKADEWYALLTQQSVSSVPFRLSFFPDWWMMAHFQLLHREAKALVEGAGPDDPNLQALQARARQELQRRDKATADYDHTLMLAPDEPRLLLARARRLGDLNRWEQAETDITRAIALKPDDPHYRSQRNRIFLARGRADELAVEYAARLDRSTAGPRVAAERSEVAQEVAEWDEVFARLAQQRPNDPFLWIGRGRNDVLRNRWKEAAADYARGIKAREPSVDWFEYAAVLYLAGDIAGYRDFVTWAAERAGASRDPFACFNLARISAIVPDSPIEPARAVRWAEHKLPAREAFRSAHALGLALYRAGRYPEAIRQLEESATQWPDSLLDGQNRLILAMAHYRLKDVATARQALAGAIARNAQQGDKTLPIPVWLGYQLLHREAEALILATSDPARTTQDR